MAEKPKPPVVTAKDLENMNAHARASVDYTQQYKKESKYNEGLLPGMDQEAHRALIHKTELDDQLSSGLIVLGCIVGVYLIYRLLLAIKRNLQSTKEIKISVTVKMPNKQKTS